MQANSTPRSPEMGTPRRACSSMIEIGKKVLTGRPLSEHELETKNAQLRRKVSSVEDEKACLQLENRQLLGELEAVQLELASYKIKVSVLSSAVESKSSSTSLMKEQMEAMENEIETHRFALRDSEKKLEEVEEILDMKCRLVEDLTDDLRALKAQLQDQTSRSQRVERQRNEALTNAENQAQAHQAYKADMTQRLKKLSENEALLKHSLIQCDSEKVEVEKRCSQLGEEKAEMCKLNSQVNEASTRAEVLKSDSLRSQLDEATRRSGDLEDRLVKKEAEVREMEAVRRESADLRVLATSLEQRLGQCQKETQQSCTQLANLEAILDLLHLRKSGGVALCVSPCLLPSVPADDAPMLQPGEQYKKLLPVLRLLKQDRERQAQLAQGLQERLRKAQEEASSMKADQAQRDQLLQQIQDQLQQRQSEVAQLEWEVREQLEREVKQKSTRLAASEKQLEEKTCSVSLALEKSSELEHSLEEKTNSVKLLTSALDTAKKDHQTALEEAQRLHLDQRKTLEDQIRMLQQSLEEKSAQVASLKRALSSAQEEIQEAHHRAGKLQTSLAHISMEAETKSQCEQEVLRTLGEQAAQYSSRVKALEASLSSCQEELSRCLQQMEKAKSHFEEQLDAKTIEVEFLQAELKRVTSAFEGSVQQSQQLQHTAQLQEARLKEISTHLTEVEDKHATALVKVEMLECELQRERVFTAEEQKRREEEVRQASQQAERHERQSAHLSTSVTLLTEDMSKYHSELSEREKDLLLIRRASGAQSSQLAQMEKMLTQTKGLLDKKTEMGMEGKPCEGDTMVQDLEEKVQRSKRDRRNSLHRTQLLESQMKTVRGELVDTLDHLQELRNVLRRSQQQAEERKAAMEKLSTGLRETQQELEQRNEQVKDKDVALKDIQHELQQKDLQLSQLESAVKEHSSDMEQKLLFLQEATERSERELSERNKQLSQLESAVKEHSSDMEQKLLFLQEATERSERELSERNKQVAFLSERLELVKAQLQGKETLEEEAMWQDQQLRECREQLQGTAQGLQEMRSRCETLVVQLEESTVLGREKESQVGLLEEELARVAEQAAQTEDRLQDAMATLTLELEAVWRKHQAELAVLQDSQAEMMKASECVANTLRSSQELLSRELQHTRVQLDEAQHKAAALLAELRAREHLMHSTSEALLLKESEVTRLKTKISSFERGAELRSLSQSMGLSLPALTSNTSRNNSPPPHRSGERAAHSPARRPWVAAGDDGTREMPYGERDGERTLNPRDCALWTSLVSGQGAP